jgi:hypothetical protein
MFSGCVAPIRHLRQRRIARSVRGRQSRIRGYFMLDRPAAATACASVQANRRAYASARHTDGFVILGEKGRLFTS